MSTRYAELFQGTKIGNVRIRNRIVMCPMGTHNYDHGGKISDAQIDYYRARAHGGTGMIITEGLYISNKYDPAFASSTIADTEEQTNNWKDLAEAIKAEGATACIQLNASLGRNSFPMGGSGNFSQLISASEVPIVINPSIKTRAMTIEEIEDMIACYGRAANRAMRAGFEIVEINAHMGYLIDQFLSSAWNKRTDKYGGNLENRARFAVEIIQAMKKSAPGMPIIIRIAVDHKYEGGRTFEESIELCKILEEAGVDALDIDLGCYEPKSKYWGCAAPYIGDGFVVDYAGELKKHVNVPVLVSGNLTPDIALNAVREGKADYVMIGRGLIADPDFANKLRESREEDIRPCLACNERCYGHILKGLAVTCSVNAACGKEKTYAIKPTENPKKIVVVGGGPGGMEAARVAALKGHDVTLYEKSDKLGGQLIPASKPDFKNRIYAYMKYLETQMRKLNVNVVLNTAIDADSYELTCADEIIVALGAVPIVPNIKGIHGENVKELFDVHLGRQKVTGNNVIIAGGGVSGCDLALELAEEGKNVTVVEMMDKVANGLFSDNHMALTLRMAKNNVEILTNHRITEFTEKGVMVEANGEIKELAADDVVVAFGTKPCSEVSERIFEKYPHARILGDCVKIGQIGDAVRAAYLAAWSID